MYKMLNNSSVAAKSISELEDILGELHSSYEVTEDTRNACTFAIECMKYILNNGLVDDEGHFKKLDKKN